MYSPKGTDPDRPSPQAFYFTSYEMSHRRSKKFWISLILKLRTFYATTDAWCAFHTEGTSAWVASAFFSSQPMILLSRYRCFFARYRCFFARYRCFFASYGLSRTSLHGFDALLTLLFCLIYASPTSKTVCIIEDLLLAPKLDRVNAFKFT